MNPDDLNTAVEFDSPFRVTPEGEVESVYPDVFPPSAYHVEGEREPDIDGLGWEFVDGYSGQHGYSGPVMHASEQLAGGMATDVLATPGVYSLAVVEDLDDPENPAGWVLLRRSTDTPQEH